MSIYFKADDAVSFVLNGQAIGECEPTEGNLGLCKQGCTKVSALKADESAWSLH